MRTRSLLPCRACARHVFADEATCPFCGETLDRTGAAARALRAGGVAAALAAAACGGITGQAGPAGGGGGETDMRATDVGGSPQAGATGGTLQATNAGGSETGAGEAGGSVGLAKKDASGPSLTLDAAVQATADAAVVGVDVRDEPQRCDPTWDNRDPCPVTIYKSPPPFIAPPARQS